MKSKTPEPKITIGNRAFVKLLGRDTIKARIQEMGRDIALDYQGKYPLFIVVLNGAFMFAADLVRATALECELQFIKLSSYEDIRSSGLVKKIIGLPAPVRGRHVVIIEDIIDTGRTIRTMMEDLTAMEPSSVSVATLLLKPDCLEYPIESTYVGFEIPDAFVIGYGLDLDGRARNLADIYQLEPGTGN
jgi:hypoxanthine phosphoribosyltransferase